MSEQGWSKRWKEDPNLERRGVRTELSVVLPIKLNGKSLTAILDSGAGPSVIDYNTNRNLGLEVLMNNKASRVYGLARKPVMVVGNINLILDFGDGQVVTHTFEVLGVTGTTRILGRDLLKRFQSTNIVEVSAVLQRWQRVT